MGSEWPSTTLSPDRPCWRRCNCGCATWHLWPNGDTAACSHSAVDLSQDGVLFVVDPSVRCGDCLLAGDETATTWTRSKLASAQTAMVAWMDAGVRALEQSITDEHQIGDMLYEGGAVWAGES